MKKCIAFSIFIIFSLLAVNQVSALPQFSRMTGEVCSYCHTQWPLLNNYGKNFKAAGYPGLRNSMRISEDLVMAKNLPIGLRVNLRAIDKRTAKNSTKVVLSPKEKQLKFRGLHEVELFFAGSNETDFGRLYYFTEIEAEDEFDNYEVRIVAGHVGLAIHPMLNVRVGYQSPFGWDGNNTVQRHKNVRYGWNGSKFVPGVSQGVSVHGKISRLTYGVAMHGGKGDLEGHDPHGFGARVAFDLNCLSVGAFADHTTPYDSKLGVSSGNDDKKGLDLNLNMGPLSVQALYAKNSSSKTNEGWVVDNNISVAADLAVDDIVLTVISDHYTAKNGAEKWHKGGMFLTYFIAENVKFQTGVEGTVTAPSKYLHTERRYTVVFDVGI